MRIFLAVSGIFIVMLLFAVVSVFVVRGFLNGAAHYQPWVQIEQDSSMH